MSEPTNVPEGSAPAGQIAPKEHTASSSREPQKNAQQADPEFVALLAETQNACLEELGYSPTLLVQFQEMKKEYAVLQNQCNLLRADNTKLYADNRSLATFIQQQDQRMKLLQDPNDQQKRTITELHESVRRLTIERDEYAGRLHAALNEVVVLRQELARFVPNAIMVSSRERMPSGGVPIPLPPHTVPSQHTIHPSMQLPAHVPINKMHYQNPPGQYQPEVRQLQALPQHRSSVPMIPHVNAAAQLPPMPQHRRPSAPALLITGHSAFVQSPISASPINGFSGLSLAASNPPTPATSRPPTATGQQPAFHQSAPPSRPPSTRGAHIHPPVPQRSSSSSLAGAVIDLTGEESTEDGMRKKRKLDHYSPPVAGPSGQPSGSINAVPPAASGSLNGMSGQMSPARADMLRTGLPPALNPQNQRVDGIGLASAAPSVAAVAAEEHASVYPPARSQPLPAPVPVPVPVPVRDVVMEDEAHEEQQTTLEEDCLEANFDEDDADETKQWCRMCRSRFQGGHTKEAPMPFVNASQQVLVEHCEQVHPRGWEILKTKVAEARAAEDAEE